MMARKAKPPTAAKPDPTEQQAAAIQAARERLARRPSAPEFAGELEDGAMALSSRHSDAAGHIEQVFDTLGSTSEAFANMVLSQICNVCQMKGDSEPKGLNAALAVVHAIKPTGELETMLGLQLFATHALSMELMGRAHRAQDNAVVQLNVNLATKLQRTFAGHLEALDRHRRGGQQRVTVEHVHVHAGGQAVVGAVTTGGEASITNGGQPHGQDLIYSFGCAANVGPGTERVPTLPLPQAF